MIYFNEEVTPLEKLEEYIEFLDDENIIGNDRKALEEKEYHKYIDFIMTI